MAYIPPHTHTFVIPTPTDPEAIAGTSTTTLSRPKDVKTYVDTRFSNVDNTSDAQKAAGGPIGDALALKVTTSTALDPGQPIGDALLPLQQTAYVRDKEIYLDNIPGIDPTGVDDSAAVLLTLQAEHAASGFTFKTNGISKIKLSSDFVINKGQRIDGKFHPQDASGIAGNDYTTFGHTFILADGAEFRLDNGGSMQGLFVYREGLVFNVDQGDFSSWVGNGVVLGYGNDQSVRDCQILGFDYGVRTLTDRGLAGPGRCILEKVYVDAKNGFRLVGSYDSAFFDKLRCFGFVTQGYAGTPAPGEGYDPRKDRRPGTGFEMVDRSDGSKIGAIEVFGYKTGFKANTAGWAGSVLTTDYGTTPTYTSAGTGSIGVHLIADTDPTGPRATDYDPSQAAVIHTWSSEVGLKIVGNPGRVAQIGAMSIVNTYGDAIQIDGGGLIAPNTRIANCSGAPVRFMKAPDTKTIINGRANNFGAARNSSAVPVVKVPDSANMNLIDVNLDNDQSAGAAYFDNFPSPQTVASADPLILPPFRGKGSESFTVTGSVSIAYMYGLRPGKVRLTFANGLTLFTGAGPGALQLPNGATELAVQAGESLSAEYNGDTDRWFVSLDGYGLTSTQPSYYSIDVASTKNLSAYDAVEIRRFSNASRLAKAIYAKAVSQPSHSMKFQDAAGNWFGIAEENIYPEMAGALSDGTSDDTAAFNIAKAVNKPIVLSRGRTYVLGDVVVPAGGLIGNRARVIRKAGAKNAIVLNTSFGTVKDVTFDQGAYDADGLLLPAKVGISTVVSSTVNTITVASATGFGVDQWLLVETNAVFGLAEARRITAIAGNVLTLHRDLEGTPITSARVVADWPLLGTGQFTFATNVSGCIFRNYLVGVQCGLPGTTVGNAKPEYEDLFFEQTCGISVIKTQDIAEPRFDDLTMETTKASRKTYTATAAQTVFDYPYNITKWMHRFDEPTITVTVNGGSQAITSGYTVDPVAGTITLATPCAAGDTVIVRNNEFAAFGAVYDGQGGSVNGMGSLQARILSCAIGVDIVGRVAGQVSGGLQYLQLGDSIIDTTSYAGIRIAGANGIQVSGVSSWFSPYPIIVRGTNRGVSFGSFSTSLMPSSSILNAATYRPNRAEISVESGAIGTKVWQDTWDSLSGYSLSSGSLALIQWGAPAHYFEAGSAAAPSMAFKVDPNTGIWHPAEDRLEVVTGGLRRLLFTEAGAVVLGSGGFFQYANGALDLSGSGTPEGVVIAPKGSTYRRIDGAAGTCFYVKESGTLSTGWVAK
jgi:hypothetical protein